MRVCTVLFVLPALCFAQAIPSNLDFERGEPGEVPPGWFVPGAGGPHAHRWGRLRLSRPDDGAEHRMASPGGLSGREDRPRVRDMEVGIDPFSFFVAGNLA